MLPNGCKPALLPRFPVITGAGQRLVLVAHTWEGNVAMA